MRRIKTSSRKLAKQSRAQLRAKGFDPIEFSYKSNSPSSKAPYGSGHEWRGRKSAKSLQPGLSQTWRRAQHERNWSK